MLNSPTVLPDSAHFLGSQHFLQQLKRLESLQTLMTQGSSVVNEVVEFMAKARAELEMLRKEQEEAARFQEAAELETTAMRTRIGELEQLLAGAEVRAKEQDLTIVRLRSELAATAAAPSADELAALNVKIASLERQLAGEHERRTRLMQVLKAHEVTVAPTLTRQASPVPAVERP
jgi:chromosome segregation ATPase